MKTSQLGIDLIKGFEGFKEKAYLCPAKVWTIGYGTTKYPNGDRVKEGDSISKKEAEKLLANDLTWAENCVNKKVHVDINQNMFNALVSFVYNFGSSVFTESNCTLLRKLNKEDYTGASNEFKRWNKADGKVLNGLIARRKLEGNLFINL